MVSLRKGQADKFAPALKKASQWGGTPACGPMTAEKLGKIMLPERPNDPVEVEAHKQRVQDYAPLVDQAFRIMGIDTVEAQGVYLGHTAGESGTMQFFEEKKGEVRKYAPFWGRGPVQVTWREMYLQTLAYLQARINQMRDSNPYDKDLPAAEAALAAIKRTPAAASNPQFTFLFSAAYMHMTSGVKRSASVGANPRFAGNGAEDRWVSSHRNPYAVTLQEAIAKGDQGAINDMKSAIARAIIKRDTYLRTYDVLTTECKAVPPISRADDLRQFKNQFADVLRQ